jgi:hypothetical protein
MALEATEVTTSNIPPETLLHYTHELTRTKRKIDEANAAHRLIVKRAKADGVPTEAILESIVWARLEPEVRRQKMIDRIKVESARHPDSAEILTDLIGKLDTRVSEKVRYTDTMFDAEQKGYQAGKYAVPIEDNPYPSGSEFSVKWREFWNEGQAANAATLGENAKAANAKREKPPTAKQRGMRARLPLGDAPAAKKVAGQKKQGTRKRAANGAETSATA